MKVGGRQQSSSHMCLLHEGWRKTEASSSKCLGWRKYGPQNLTKNFAKFHQKITKFHQNFANFHKILPKFHQNSTKISQKFQKILPTFVKSSQNFTKFQKRNEKSAHQSQLMSTRLYYT